MTAIKKFPIKGKKTKTHKEVIATLINSVQDDAMDSNHVQRTTNFDEQGKKAEEVDFIQYGEMGMGHTYLLSSSVDEWFEKLRKVCPNAVLQSCSIGYFVQVLVWTEQDSEAVQSKGEWRHLTGICSSPEEALYEAVSSKELVNLLLCDLPNVPTLNQQGTTTGRFSGSDTNLSQGGVQGIRKYLEQLRGYGFHCEAGMLEDAQPYRDLCKTLGIEPVERLTAQEYLDKLVIAEGEADAQELQKKGIEAIILDTNGTGSVTELESVDVEPWATKEEMDTYLAGLVGKQVKGKRQYHAGSSVEPGDDGMIVGTYIGSRANESNGRIHHNIQRVVNKKTRATAVFPESIRPYSD